MMTPVVPSGEKVGGADLVEHHPPPVAGVGDECPDRNRKTWELPSFSDSGVGSPAAYCAHTAELPLPAAMGGGEEVNFMTSASADSGALVASSPTKRRRSSQSAPSRSTAWSEKASLEPMMPEDLGVAFYTRAAGDIRNLPADSGHRQRHLRSISRVFPTRADTGDLGNKLWPESWADGCLTGTTWYHSTSQMALRTQKFMKMSSLFTFVFALGGWAMEPACVPESAGSPLTRFWISPNHSMEGGLALIHVVNGLLYNTLAVVSRRVFGRVDPQHGEEITQVKEVVWSHFKSLGLWMDLVAFTGFMGELVHLFEAPRGGIATPAQWLMLLQLAKMWRILVPEVSLNVHPERNLFLEGVGWLFLQLAFFAHFMACFLVVLGSHEGAWGSRSWIDDIKPVESDNSCPSFYIESTYFAVLSQTSVGYGDHVAKLVTPLERAINALFLLCAQLYSAKVCADLTWLTSTHNHWEAKHQARTTQTWTALRKLQVPSALRSRVLAFQHYVATVHREDLAQTAFEGLSENLIKELRLCAYRKLVMQAPFLREQTKEVITLIVGCLRDAVYLPADFIVRFGEKGRELFFLRRGSAAVFVGVEPPMWGQDEEVASYSAGNYFGELAMLTGRPRAAWVMAKSYCVCSVLTYQDVEDLGKEHPGAFTSLVQSMIRSYHLKPSLAWADVGLRLQEKYAFESIEDAFNWCCDQGDYKDEEELSAKAFDEVLRRLKVPELDRKIFWAELDADNTGFVTFEEFIGKVSLPPIETIPVDHRRFRCNSKRTTHVYPADDRDPKSPRALRRLSKRLHSMSSTTNSQVGGPSTADVLAEIRKELAESREQTKRLTDEIQALRTSTVQARCVAPTVDLK